MVIFINSNGSISTIIPSVVTQGSNNTQSIVLIAENISQFSAVSIDFELPNGQYIDGGIMLPSDITIGGNLFNAYSYVLSNSLTNFVGKVEVGFSIQDPNSAVLKTYNSNFMVIETNEPVLPEVPSIDVYEQILNGYAYLLGVINTGQLESKCILPYDSSFSYSNNAITFNVLENGFVDFYRSLVDDNIGNDLSDGEFWQKQDNYYTKPEVDTILEDYYTKTETGEVLEDYYTKTASDNKFLVKDFSELAEQITAQITDLIAIKRNNDNYKMSLEALKTYLTQGLVTLQFRIVEELPVIGYTNIIYLTPIVSNKEIYPTLEDFPETGEENIRYIAEDTGINYLWNGDTYIIYNKGYIEYIWLEDLAKYESLGSTEIYLDAYYTKIQIDSILEDYYTKTETDTVLEDYATIEELDKKVDKEEGKGLISTEEQAAIAANTANRHSHANKAILDNTTASYTTGEASKLAGIAEGAQVNKLETVKVNGSALTITSKAVDITVPTKVSDLEDTTEVTPIKRASKDGEGNTISSTYSRVVDIVDTLLSVETTKPLSAAQGKVLRELIEAQEFAKVFVDIETMVANLNSVSASSYRTAFGLLIIQLDVPDFWITEVMPTSVEYTYTTDAALIAAVTEAPLQIGYYKISKSETAKVDLTNYVQKSRTIAGLSLEGDITKAALQEALDFNTKVDKATTINGFDLSENRTLNADDIPFDNSSSGLTATNVQDAIDEIGGGSSYVPNTLKDPNKTYLVVKISTDNNEFTLLTGTTGSPNYIIEWGDGSSEDVVDTSNPTHIYEKAGMYLITISGSFTNGIVVGNTANGNKSKMIEVYGGSNYPTSIGDYAFRDCSNLTTAIFPNVTSIGNTAFRDCSNLITANIPKATSIGGSAFYECTNLTTATFPNVTSIGNIAFFRCTNLITATFPKATGIGDTAFSDCSNLITATFPNVTYIGGNAFLRCPNLKTLTLGNVTTTATGTRFYNVVLDSLTISGNITEADITRIKTFFTDNGGSFSQSCEIKYGLQVEKTPTADLDVVRKVDLNDKADKATTLSGYGITDAYTKTEIESKIASVYKYKGSVANYASLPTTDLTIGDVYNVEDTGDNYAWTGTEWDKLAGTIDLSNMVTTNTTQTIAGSKTFTENIIGNITGNAATAATASGCGKLIGTDTRNVNTLPNGYFSQSIGFVSEFKQSSVIGLSDSYYCLVLTNVPWSDATGGLPSQVAYMANGNIYKRAGASATTWGAWNKLATTNDIDSAIQNAIYPIGSIYQSTKSTSPASLFGGTWNKIMSNVTIAANDIPVRTGANNHILPSNAPFNAMKLVRVDNGSTGAGGRMLNLGTDATSFGYTTNASVGTQEAGMLPANLWAQSSGAVNKISGIYMWKRIS